MFNISRPYLEDIRKELPGQKFSMGCALSVGIQCLEAIEELHAIGFLHRLSLIHLEKKFEIKMINFKIILII